MMENEAGPKVTEEVVVTIKVGLDMEDRISIRSLNVADDIMIQQGHDLVYVPYDCIEILAAAMKKVKR
jgi:hypothetical protein